MGADPFSWAALILSAAGAASSVVNAQEAKKDAAKQAKLEKRQAALQARAQQVRTQREARLRKAQLIGAQSAQGTIGSAVIGGEIALTTQADNQLDLISSQLAVQNRQFDLQRDQFVSAANANIAQAIGSFAATTFTPTGKSETSLWDRTIGASLKGDA